MKQVLHAGCGRALLPLALYPDDQWKEIRLDIDRMVYPHIVAGLAEIPLETGYCEAVFCSHALEHLFDHEVTAALAELHRILAPGGIATILVPDIESVALEILKGGLERVLYDSSAGPIRPADILWGHRGMVAAGNHYYAHKTGFTADSLGQELVAAGFIDIAVTQDASTYGLTAHATKPQGARP